MKLRGKAVRGAGRGRALGFPTANLEIEGERPEIGVYAGRCIFFAEPPPPPGSRCDDTPGVSPALPCAVHVGPVPTFNDAQHYIEVHILDFEDRDLYGEEMEVELAKKIRDVKKFSSEEELIEAIAEDCQETRELL